jgi:hypothetical protein
MTNNEPKKRSQAEILADLHNLVHQIEHEQLLKNKTKHDN